MEEWKECKLGELCNTISDTYKRGAKEVVLINTSDVLEGKCMNHERVLNEKLKGQFKKTFQYNDILYSEIRPANKRFAFVDFDATDYIASTKLMVLRHNDIIIPQYLFYILKSQNVIDELQMLAESRSGTFPQITFSELSNLSVLLPNKDLQYKIVSILSSLDDKIEVNRRINEQLEELAGALFKSWFVDFDPFKDGEFVDSELGMIPKGWKVDYIANIPHVIETGKRPKGGVGNISNGIPSIGAENIKGLGYYDYSKTKFVTEDFANKMKKGEIKGYELLIYKDGGKPGYFIPNFSIFGEGFPFERMYLNEHVFKLDFYNRGFNIFSYFYFKTDLVMSYLNAQGGKAAIPGINQKDVENIPIFTMDNEYVKLFCEKVIPIIEKILFNSKEIHHLTTLRDTLLPKLMSGEISVK